MQHKDLLWTPAGLKSFERGTLLKALPSCCVHEPHAGVLCLYLQGEVPVGPGPTQHHPVLISMEIERSLFSLPVPLVYTPGAQSGRI